MCIDINCIEYIFVSLKTLACVPFWAAQNSCFQLALIFLDHPTILSGRKFDCRLVILMDGSVMSIGKQS